MSETMDCPTCQRSLLDAIENPLAPERRERLDDHLRACPACREIAELVRTEPTVGAAEAPAGLSRAILARTSGPACESARERLCDLVDGVLDGVAGDLVRSHLDGCPDCAALHATLARLELELCTLADLVPDDRFVSDVLARTSRRRRVGIAGRLAEAWQGLVRRPRLAWEAGYVGAMLFWLTLTLSGGQSPGSEAAALPRAVERAGALPAFAGDAGRRVLTGVRASWESAFAGLEAEVAERYERSAGTRRSLVQHGAALGETLGDLAREARAIAIRFTGDPDNDNEE